MVVLSDMWPLYTHTFLSTFCNKFALNRSNFYLKSVKFLFLVSIYLWKKTCFYCMQKTKVPGHLRNLISTFVFRKMYKLS